jgi:hypothetical protein
MFLTKNEKRKTRKVISEKRKVKENEKRKIKSEKYLSLLALRLKTFFTFRSSFFT